MTRHADLLVVGGGIAGLTSALAAASRGLSVRVIGAERPGSASRAAAGMLAPSVEGLPPDVLPLALAARDFYPGFLRDLRARAQTHVALDRNGILQLADSPDSLAALIRLAGAKARVLDAAELALLEPAFADRQGGLLHPADGAVDNVALMGALELAAAREPRIEYIRGTVSTLDCAPRCPVACMSSGARYESGTLLLAAGSWANGVAGLPRSLPVRPLRGQLLRLDRVPITHVTYAAGGYLVPRADSLLIGATSEETGFANNPTEQGLATLRAIATRAIPALSGAKVVDHWAGLRPVTPDALPILGPDPDIPQLFYACGFSRNGILLAPWAANRLAAILSGEIPGSGLARFSVSRFG